MPTTEAAGEVAITLPAPAAVDRRTEIATIYAGLLREKHPEVHSGQPSNMHFAFADAVLARDAFGLKHLANGLNEVGKAAFTRVTGVKLPKLQGQTWVALRAWGLISDKADAHAKALRKVETEVKFCPLPNVEDHRQWIKERIAHGFTTLQNVNHRWLLMNDARTGYDLSRQGSGLTKLRPLIEAELALHKATLELEAERTAQVEQMRGRLERNGEVDQAAPEQVGDDADGQRDRPRG